MFHVANIRGVMKKTAEKIRHYALVVSAGNGKRFGQSPPKQFSSIDGKTILELSLENLLSSVSLSGVIIAVPKKYTELSERILKSYIDSGRAILITGGDERRDSILKLIKEAQSQFDIQQNDTISIVDANRPLTSKSVLLANIKKAMNVGVSCPTLPLVNGVAAIGEGGKVMSVPKRDQMVQIVTPESAKWSDIATLIPTWESTEGLAGLAELFVFCGRTVGTVPSDRYSMKITNPEDWEVFESLYRQWLDKPLRNRTAKHR